MGRFYSGALWAAAAVIFTMGGPMTAMAYGPGSGVYHRGGPGVNNDYGGSSGSQGNAQAKSDNMVRAYPGFNTNVPDPSSNEFNPDDWRDWEDDWDDNEEDDWWYYSGGPGVRYGQGWRYSPGGWWFQLYGGSWLADGWQLIHGRWYRFGQDGTMGCLFMDTVTPDGYRVGADGALM